MLARSMEAPLGTAGRMVFTSAVVVLGGLVLGACTVAGGGKDDARGPLAVKSRQEASAWADQVLAHLRQTAGGQSDRGIPTVGYFACPGMGLAAPESPFTMGSGINLDVPDDQRIEVVRKVRDALGREGLKVSEYQESSTGAPSAVPTASFQAEHAGDGPFDHYTVLLESAKPGKGVSIIVNTPCLRPPSGTASPTAAATTAS